MFSWFFFFFWTVFPSVILPLAQFGDVRLGSVVWDEGRAGGLSREPEAGFQTPRSWLGCQRICAEMLDCWTAHPEACLRSSQAEAIQQRWRGEREKRRLTAETTMFCTVHPPTPLLLWDVWWVEALCASALQCMATQLHGSAVLQISPLNSCLNLSVVHVCVVCNLNLI